ncbi:hypothetical protein CH063_11885 [Colletotrichum higginsianum]|uniref:Uncharacterized protein n=1 Tax=Colletotrichum higginsianum (strain IMI 349063) TaxID=759273 RepID=H1VN70_COLHI|nr:hypothetical protein CH063_11885 [Colletotrichum higginsianum]
MSYPHDQPTAPAPQPVKPVAAAPRPRPRCSQPMPFDPEELSQKLAKDARPPHASLAREYLDMGSVKPGHSTSRPRVQPPALKPRKETADPGFARQKSKTSDGDHRDSQTSGKESSRRKGSDSERHHFVPQFAAAQFARTTTAENMSDNKGLVRKLSRTALKLAQGHRERHQERGNTQRDRIPEIAELGNDRANCDRNHHRHTIV